LLRALVDVDAGRAQLQSVLPAGQVVKRTSRILISPWSVISSSLADPRAGRSGSSNSAPVKLPVPSAFQLPVPPFRRTSGERYSTLPTTSKRLSEAS
jgi:hypothetical protein